MQIFVFFKTKNIQNSFVVATAQSFSYRNNMNKFNSNLFENAVDTLDIIGCRIKNTSGNQFEKKNHIFKGCEKLKGKILLCGFLARSSVMFKVAIKIG